MDDDFKSDPIGLHRAVDLLAAADIRPFAGLPECIPESGIGPAAVMETLAPRVLGGAARLGSEISFGHMDPPTPWITWATTLWNAALNQNLLHHATAPAARDIEARAIAWLSPFFGMQGGHMTAGSTISNLTALWAARECAGLTEVAAGAGAHLSIAKSAHLLGLRFRPLASTPSGTIDPDAVDDASLERTAFVLTAGTTSTGAIDPLSLVGRAAWTHVDGAWAGPLRFSKTYAARLNGIEQADSIAISAHKLLFQPKEAGIVLFRDVESAHAGISFGGGYLTSPNIGVAGSHGAVAVPLVATLLAWGRSGLALRIERCMELAERFARFIEADPRLQLLTEPQSGIVVWRPRNVSRTKSAYERLPQTMASLTRLDDELWIRNVAANPSAELDALISAVTAAIDA